MLEAGNRAELREHIHAWKQCGHSIALVPTMGNLHAGHLALVTAARGLADRVVTSIYVNPTQFAANEDLAAYPRTLAADCESLQRTGCDLVFVPDSKTIYPYGEKDACMLAAPRDLASVLEGEFRPGHFDGVVTVVSRLFNLVTPDVAIFGEKDYQQLLILQRMAEDLGYKVAIHALPTVREKNGLALSSRNRYLNAEQKSAAQKLSMVLRDAAALAAERKADFKELESQAKKRLELYDFRVDYVSIRRACDLGIAQIGDREIRILAAARCGSTRLIDNYRIKRACNYAD